MVDTAGLEKQPIEALEVQRPPQTDAPKQIGPKEDQIAQKIETEINKILTSPDFTPKKLVDVLKESFNLRELYEGSVGVWEGYSLEEHTLMAMGQFERYFSSDWDSSLVSKEHFRLMLALHDLGKPQAFRETNSITKQHEYTMRMVPGILQQAGLDQREIDIIKGVINQNFLGDYVRNRQSLEMTAKLISERAQQVGVPATEFMNLLRIYYMCDAGSYTEDAGGKRSLDELFTFDRDKGKMGFDLSLQDKFDKLLGNLEFQKVPQKEIAQAPDQPPKSRMETVEQDDKPTIKRGQLGSFLELSVIKHPLIHYSLDAESLRERGFDIGKRGAGLKSRAIEPIGVSLVDPELPGAYNNPFEVNDKIESLKERSPKAERVEVAADVRKPLVVKDLDELWKGSLYKKAVERLGYKYNSGSIVLGTGDFVIDQNARPLQDIPQDELRKSLTEVLKSEGFDAVIIEELAEVLVLDPKKLRILED